ncbi:MAG: beta-ketoacyl synthase N-terminal-like domain-containing protein, partial [Alphaproteobacteria bacterium]
MNTILLSLLYGKLQSLKVLPSEGEGEWRRPEGFRKVYERWLDESLRVLSANGYIRLDGQQCTVLEGKADIQALLREWEEQKQNWLQQEALKHHAVLVSATIKALPEILTGKVLATDIMFPDSSMELVEGIYRGNPVSNHFNGILAHHVAAAVKARLDAAPAARVKILEIGAGTGGTSVSVFEKLRPLQHGIEEYCYTDLSRAFLFHAEREYGPDVPYLTCRLFDVTMPVAAQGIAVSSYDLVIATNVLHATPDIRRSVRNAKAVLRPGGLLLLNELSDNRLFNHLTFGLLEGWWAYEDPALRIPGCPVLTPETWSFVLEHEGFRAVRFAASDAQDLGQQIIIGESDGIIRQGVAPVKPTIRVQEPVVAPAMPIAPTPAEPQTCSRRADPQEGVEQIKPAVLDCLSQILRVSEEDIDDGQPFSGFGLDSILGVKFIRLLNEKLSIELSTTCIFDYATVHQLSGHIASLRPAAISREERYTPKVQYAASALADNAPNVVRKATAFPDPAPLPEGQHEPIAIIGMSGRYAQSRNLNELWSHLESGTCLVSDVTRWDLSQHLNGTSFCQSGSFIDGIDEFAPMFFNISGIEAAYMDPQQRLFLEEAWTALEDAGYAGVAMDGRPCGVYVGCGDVEYTDLYPATPPAHSMWGSAASIVPARISYHLNLQGPAIAVDTACSSSLVATHLACQGLWNGETELALAGGVFLMCTPNVYKIANGAAMLSPSGRCYTFDDRADGFVPGEGVGVVVLKRLSDALASGDHIYGVIRGSAINQDGSTNGITAPSALSQERLERYVYDTFAIDPAGIQMVEAHGTGTKLGDPIEYEALTKAFRAYTGKQDYCAIGSIKSNLGHTTAAAGVTGIIKILLSLQHRKIPASVNFETGNSNIAFAGSPFYVNTALRDWTVEPGETRRAALSAFGFSGTNAHLVIEEAPVQEVPPAEKPGYLFVLSARMEEELQAQIRNLREYCERNPDVNCANLSFTLLMGRRHFNHRWACVASSASEFVSLAAKWLKNGDAPQVYAAKLNEKAHREKISLKRYGDQCIAQVHEAVTARQYLEELHGIADLYVQGYALDYGQLFA